MLLRPAKLFSPLHQLGKYLEGKVTELVQQQPPPHTSFQIARKRFYHASPNTQLFKAHYHSKTVPTLYHVAEREQQRLLRVLQKQFPIVKVFSSPTIVRPTGYQLSFAKNISQSHMQQFRTIVSSGASSTSTSSAAAVEGGFAGFGGGFFPRTPMVGYARTPFAARQFSTARSPCVTMFQQSTANSNGISHVSRFFSPAGSKMWVPNVNESHGRPSPSPSLSQDDDVNGKSSGANTVSLCNNNNNRKQQHEELKQQQTQQSSCRRSTTRKDRKRRRNTNAARRYRYDYLHHDDLSCRYMPGSEKKAVPSSIRHHWQTSQLKAPPDATAAVVYLSIKLDGASFWEQHFEDSSQLLDAAFIGSLHSVSELYQMFLGQVVVLLNTLQKCGTFELVVSDDRELRVIFPSSQYWPAEDRKNIACRWLAEIGIDPSSTCFTIEEMKPPSSSTSFSESHDMTTQQDSDVLGPDYFKGIQAFLDHVDEMIETGPAFGRR